MVVRRNFSSRDLSAKETIAYPGTKLQNYNFLPLFNLATTFTNFQGTFSFLHSQVFGHSPPSLPSSKLQESFMPRVSKFGENFLLRGSSFFFSYSCANHLHFDVGLVLIEVGWSFYVDLSSWVNFLCMKLCSSHSFTWPILDVDFFEFCMLENVARWC